MANVVGIRFRRAGKIYHFSPGNLEMKKGDKVVVETSRGVEFGEIVVPPHDETDDKIIQPLKEVIRMATEEDIAHEAENKKKEIQALDICLQKIHKHELDMKLIDCEIPSTTPRSCSISLRTAVSISVTWSRIWLPFSIPGSSSVRSGSVTRPRSSGDWDPAAGSCAAMPIFPISCRSRSRWRRNRTFP